MAAGGGRWAQVAPERIERWIAGFVERHGPVQIGIVDGALSLGAADGAMAQLHPPAGAATPTDVPSFVAGALAPRRLGLVLARRGAVAVGVAQGPDLVVSKVNTSYVQGRTAAGGWSQQRFARRRANQARSAAGEAADIVARLLLPEAGALAAVVVGGDRATLETILADRRLASVAALRRGPLLESPEPRRAVLVEAVAAARAVRIRLTDPPPEP
ncbi:acVLRF1 family peptidyl-tRNA hydrolase [Pilimelia columellifera subsp. columellifera]|uniref:AcVLRF1 family peptidyl-tRNA hydrolase n=2 Tax=Pilimelia TaxID=53370 RepID=A0ABN3NB32_9ACTN